MKKIYVTLITALFMTASSVGFTDGHRGGGADSAGQEGFSGAPSAVTPRDFGGTHDEGTMLHNRMFNESEGDSQGAWSKDKIDGKDKPSDEK